MARIAIFDYRVVSTNPIGGCHLRMLRELCREHEFTVFAVEFDNPDPGRIEFVRIPVPKRPLAALFLGFHALAPLTYAAYRLRGGKAFDAVQMTESNLSFGNISYAQFCHRFYMARQWNNSKPRGLRGALRWLDHRLHAMVEPWIYRRVQTIVVPSQGLARELAGVYPYTAPKITVLPNAVDVHRLTPPANFDRQQRRTSLGAAPGDVLMAFVALGHYERKGLPFLLEAMRRIQDPALKLVVVGGSPDLVEQYRRRTAEMGLANSVVFAGSQTDVRPYLWSADAFAFPSAYETFSLACYEAAAARLPLLSCRVNGIEDILTDGETGFAMDPNADSVTTALRRFLECGGAGRAAMGEAARAAAEPYDVAGWADRWRGLYSRLGHMPHTPGRVRGEVERGAHVA
jgi:glycosyltransferase involved in cell wall biosynthesis